MVINADGRSALKLILLKGIAGKIHEEAMN